MQTVNSGVREDNMAFTYRELRERLNELTETQLNMQVEVAIYDHAYNEWNGEESFQLGIAPDPWTNTNGTIYNNAHINLYPADGTPLIVLHK